MSAGIRFAELIEGTITRHAVDQVGNDLTAVLKWCATHVEPVRVFGDRPYTCPHNQTVGWASDGECMILTFPWTVAE
jgi:hypothetical protein